MPICMEMCQTAVRGCVANKAMALIRVSENAKLSTKYFLINISGHIWHQRISKRKFANTASNSLRTSSWLRRTHSFLVEQAHSVFRYSKKPCRRAIKSQPMFGLQRRFQRILERILISRYLPIHIDFSAHR